MSITHNFSFAKNFSQLTSASGKSILRVCFCPVFFVITQGYGYFFGGDFMSYKLDDNQMKIAMHTTGPALTLAGPGSGKTTVLTERTVRLSKKVRDPSEILCVTFTNAAGKEMKSRYIKASVSYGDKVEKIPVFKTVHSFCNEIIREYEKINSINYKRIEGENKLKDRIIIELYKDINGNLPENNILEKLRALNCESKKIPEIKNVKKILEKYKTYKREYNLIDFDDMILFAKDILTSHSEDKRFVKDIFCNRFKYIQVDEAQDLTAGQFEIMEIIAANRNIFVVADDDQSIYGFRGAAPGCLFEFQKKYSDAKTYYLSKNYRSVKNIVDCSCKFISANKERFDKKLYSEKETGTIPAVRCFKNGIKQAEFILKESQKLLSTEPGLSICVLYRNNLSGLLPKATFINNACSFRCESDFFKTNEIDFLDIIISKMRRMERKSIFVPTPSKILRSLKEEGLYIDLEEYCRESGRNMYYKYIVTEFIEYLCKNNDSVTKMVEMLDKIDNANSHSNNRKNIFAEFSTVHSSKGLEYDVVFIIDVVKGEFPGRGSTTGAALEEERRLFYVAMTRAKKYLYVLYPERGEYESLFVNEIKKIVEDSLIS